MEVKNVAATAGMREKKKAAFLWPVHTPLYPSGALVFMHTLHYVTGIYYEKVKFSEL